MTVFLLVVPVAGGCVADAEVVGAAFVPCGCCCCGLCLLPFCCCCLLRCACCAALFFFFMVCSSFLLGTVVVGACATCRRWSTINAASRLFICLERDGWRAGPTLLLLSFCGFGKGRRYAFCMAVIGTYRSTMSRTLSLVRLLTVFGRCCWRFE